jgi:hypothetical protein
VTRFKEVPLSMDIDRFIKLVSDPIRGREEIKTMMRNAITKGELELAKIAKDALDSRFPGWEKALHKDSGATPTLVRFNLAEKVFPTAKEAYCWLIERFVDAYPEPFIGINWETHFIGEGRTQLYFARDPKKLFRKAAYLAEDLNRFHTISNGWYVNLSLDNQKKFRILCNFAAVAKLQWERDWFWKVLD